MKEKTTKYGTANVAVYSYETLTKLEEEASKQISLPNHSYSAGQRKENTPKK